MKKKHAKKLSIGLSFLWTFYIVLTVFSPNAYARSSSEIQSDIDSKLLAIEYKQQEKIDAEENAKNKKSIFDEKAIIYENAQNFLSQKQRELQQAQYNYDTNLIQNVTYSGSGVIAKVYNMAGYNNAPPMPGEDRLINTTTVSYIDFNWGGGNILSNRSEDVIVKFTGTITSTNSGYFSLYSPADDGTKLYVEDSLIINDWYDKGGGGSISQAIYFEANKPKNFTLWFYENGGGASVSLYWNANGWFQPIPSSAFQQATTTYSYDPALLQVLNQAQSDYDAALAQYNTAFDDLNSAEQDYALAVQQLNLIQDDIDNLNQELFNLQQELISSIAEEEQAIADVVINKISELPSIDQIQISDEPIVSDIRYLYEALTDNQKSLVSNYSVLVDAEQKISQLKQEKIDNDIAQALIISSLIDNIPYTISIEDEPIISNARQAYESLTIEQKILVSNIEKLAFGESEIIRLKEIQKDNQQKALDVYYKIDSLPLEIFLDDETLVAEARASFDGLTDYQKSLVYNYNKLVLSEQRIAQLKQDEINRQNLINETVLAAEQELNSAVNNATSEINKITNNPEKYRNQIEVINAGRDISIAREAILNKDYMRVDLLVSNAKNSLALAVNRISYLVEQEKIPPWFQYEVWENQDLNVSAPDGKIFSDVTAWYGDPNNSSCGAYVNDQVLNVFYNKKTGTINANNGIFGDPCGGIVKVLRVSFSYTDEVVVTPTPTPTPEPTPEPSPSPKPSIEPSPSPVVTPTPEPSVEPTPAPTPEPSSDPVSTPDPSNDPGPVETPSRVVDSTPVPEPTQEPVDNPTPVETPAPTEIEQTVQEQLKEQMSDPIPEISAAAIGESAKEAVAATAEFVKDLFTNPAAAGKALLAIGSSMTEEERAAARPVVIATVVVNIISSSVTGMTIRGVKIK